LFYLYELTFYVEYPGITLLNSIASIVITADSQRYSIYQNSSDF